MTWLAKIGGFLAKGIAVLSGLEPLIAPYIGAKGGTVATTVVNDLTAVGSVVVQAEALLGSGTGPQKLAAAAPLVANVVKTSELLAGKHIKNETLFIQGCTDLTNAVAEILNSLDPGTVQSSGSPLPPTPPPSPASPVPAAAVTPAAPTK